MIIRQADFVDRNNFADFLNRRGLTGAAAEVGVHRGEWSRIFLDNWRGTVLHLIDPWTIPKGYESQAKLLPGFGEDRSVDLQMCREHLAPHGGRVAFVRTTSLEAAATFARESLDFVYVDGDHRYDRVTADLKAWWPKVRPGGILAGHDVLSSEPYSAYEEVQPAVLNFANDSGLDVYLVIELVFQPWSFLIEKPAR